MGREQTMRRSWLVTVALVATGCVFSIDGSVVKPSSDGGDERNDASRSPNDAAAPSKDSGEQLDAEQPDSETGDRDAEPAPDAHADGGDELPIEPDACPEGGCPHPCTSDSQCTEAHYCSRAVGTCAPRCNETFDCAGAPAPVVHSMLGDGQTLYWTTRSDATDALGAPLPNGNIWSWDLQDQAVMVSSDAMFPYLRFVADGFLYYMDNRDPNEIGAELRRVKLSPPSSPEIVAEKVAYAWKTGQFIYWSTAHFTPTNPIWASTAELWRKPRAAAGAAERLAVGQHDGWHSGNEEFAFHVEFRDQSRASLVADRIDDLTMAHDIFGPDAGIIDVENLTVAGSRLYFVWGLGYGTVRGVDLTEPGELTLLSPVSGSVMYFSEQAGWVYWSAKTHPNPGASTAEITYGRSHGTLRAPAVRLLQRSVNFGMHDDALATDSQFSIVGQQLVYWNRAEGRFFVLALPPLPCSETLACPNGQSCTPAMLCE
jgi:hypothetical protein